MPQPEHAMGAALAALAGRIPPQVVSVKVALRERIVTITLRTRTHAAQHSVSVEQVAGAINPDRIFARSVEILVKHIES